MRSQLEGDLLKILYEVTELSCQVFPQQFLSVLVESSECMHIVAVYKSPASV